jgi:signal transduction histidine kinase
VERTRELLRDLDRQAVGMAQLLKNFLDLGGDAPARTKMPLTQAFHDVEKLLSPLARLRNLSFEALVTGDPAREVSEPGFRQAILNLGLNAVHFATSRVVLEVKVEPDACVVSVGDDGPGVPPAEEPLLFTAFSASRPGGTGVGLAQVREAVEREGGTIHHERIAPTGARFVMRLP